MGSTKSTGNIFLDMGFSPEEAGILSLKTALLNKIDDIVKKRSLSRRDLEKIFDMPQPRISALMTGKLHMFSLEAYIHYLSLLGEQIKSIEFQHMEKAA